MALAAIHAGEWMWRSGALGRSGPWRSQTWNWAEGTQRGWGAAAAPDRPLWYASCSSRALSRNQMQVKAEAWKWLCGARPIPPTPPHNAPLWSGEGCLQRPLNPCVHNQNNWTCIKYICWHLVDMIVDITVVNLPVAIFALQGPGSHPCRRLTSARGWFLRWDPAQQLASRRERATTRGWSHPHCLAMPGGIGSPRTRGDPWRERRCGGAAGPSGVTARRRERPGQVRTCSLLSRGLLLTRHPISVPGPEMKGVRFHRPHSTDKMADLPAVQLLLLLASRSAMHAWDRQVAAVGHTLNLWRQLQQMPTPINHQTVAAGWSSFSGCRVYSPVWQVPVVVLLHSGGGLSHKAAGWPIEIRNRVQSGKSLSHKAAGWQIETRNRGQTCGVIWQPFLPATRLRSGRALLLRREVKAVHRGASGKIRKWNRSQAQMQLLSGRAARPAVPAWRQMLMWRWMLIWPSLQRQRVRYRDFANFPCCMVGVLT